MSRKSVGGILTGLLVGALATLAGAGQGEPGFVVDRLQSAYRGGSAEAMLALYAEDATFEDVNQRHRFTGREQIGAMLAGLVAVHHSMDLEETRRLVRGDTVVVEYVYKGQLNGAALGASVGKEGCPDLDYEIPATSWFRIERGRIAHQRDYLDWATFLEIRQQMLAAGS